MVESRPVSRYLSEFIGTYFLLLTIGCNSLSGQPVWGGVSIACVLMVMVYALGDSSGANFNPAVTLSLALCGKFNGQGGWTEAAIYIVVQLVGGLGGAISAAYMFNKAFLLMPTAGHSMWQAGLAEMIYTAMLCFVVLNTAASKVHGGNNQFYGMAIGFVIVAGAYGAGSISMGCFNPAVAFGIDFSNSSPTTYSLLYAFWEIAGAILAVVLFWACRPDEIGRRVERAENGDIIYPPGSKLIAEAVGTFMLVLTVALNISAKSQAAAYSIGASLMCMVYALGSVSGAHFNPAVTLAIMVSQMVDKSSRQRPSLDMGLLVYMPAQFFAGGIGAVMGNWISSGSPFKYDMQFATARRYGSGSGFLAELVFTFVLCYVVLSVATVTYKRVLSQYFGFAIGACVVAGGNAVGAISGGALNPAVALNFHGGSGFRAMDKFYFALAEFLGGVAAAMIFRATQPSEYFPPKGAGKV